MLNYDIFANDTESKMYDDLLIAISKQSIEGDAYYTKVVEDEIRYNAKEVFIQGCSDHCVDSISGIALDAMITVIGYEMGTFDDKKDNYFAKVILDELMKYEYKFELTDDIDDSYHNFSLNTITVDDTVIELEIAPTDYLNILLGVREGWIDKNLFTEYTNLTFDICNFKTTLNNINAYYNK